MQRPCKPWLTLAAGLMISSTATAQSGTTITDAQSVAFDERGTEKRPIIYMGRAGFAVPANASGDVQTYGIGVGTEYENGNYLGLRAIYIPDPPPNPLSTSSADEVGIAWGPVLDWQYHFKPEYNLNFFTSVSVGYIYGVPVPGDDGTNLILPIVEAGFGARMTRRTSDGKRYFVAPELGFVPAAVAPYFAISAGIVIPGAKS